MTRAQLGGSSRVFILSEAEPPNAECGTDGLDAPFADFDFYSNVFGGNRLSEKDFERSAWLASLLIERETLGRALQHSDDQRLKLCCCAVAEAVNDCAASGGYLKKSESVGAWSYTLSSAADNATAQSSAKMLCRCYLPVKWLYRGVARE